jgi:hypothetical protein
MPYTYIKDLLDLPGQVSRGDFVLRLTEGVSRPDETLRDYVVKRSSSRRSTKAEAVAPTTVGEPSVLAGMRTLTPRRVPQRPMPRNGVD